MRKFVSILLLSLSIITLIACTKNKQQSLDGEYYWISSERNELAFTIKGNRGSIKHGEADSFIINKKKEYDRINWTKYCKSNRRIFI